MQRAFRYPLRTKGIARMMVWVWMFALMSSLANACVLSSSVRGERFGHLHSAGHDAVAGIIGIGTDHDHEPQPAKAACKGFCDLEQGTVLKSHAPSGLDLGAAPLLQAELWPVPFARVAPRVSLATYREPPPGPPVAIRFLRLTI